jgi:hypothetical protein
VLARNRDDYHIITSLHVQRQIKPRKFNKSSEAFLPFSLGRWGKAFKSVEKLRGKAVKFLSAVQTIDARTVFYIRLVTARSYTNR